MHHECGALCRSFQERIQGLIWLLGLVDIQRECRMAAKVSSQKWLLMLTMYSVALFDGLA